MALNYNIAEPTCSCRTQPGMICFHDRKLGVSEMPKSKGKVGKVMHEFKHGTLRSGSKKGPKVKSRKQAIAIGLSEARKAGERVSQRRGKRGKSRR